MGKPSDRRYAARRLGRRERAHVKKHRRGSIYEGNVPGGGTAWVKLGRKKTARWFRWYLKQKLSADQKVKQ